MTNYYLPKFEYQSGNRTFPVVGAAVYSFGDGQNLELVLEEKLFTRLSLYSKTLEQISEFRKKHGLGFLEFEANLKGVYEGLRIFNNFELDKGVLKSKGYNQNHSDFSYLRGFDFLKAVSEQLIKKGQLNPVMHQNLEKIMEQTIN